MSYIYKSTIYAERSLELLSTCTTKFLYLAAHLVRGDILFTWVRYKIVQSIDAECDEGKIFNLGIIYEL